MTGPKGIVELIRGKREEDSNADNDSDDRDDDSSNARSLVLSGQKQSRDPEDERDRQQHPTDNECFRDTPEDEPDDANAQRDAPQRVLLFR